MKYNVFLLIFALLFVGPQIFAQKSTARSDEDTAIVVHTIYNPDAYVWVDQAPEFPGGMVALRKYIADHVKYPEIAKENEIEGTVIIKFIVECDGELSNITVLRGVDPVLDSEAVRVIRSLPKFKPGMQNGCPVRVWFTLPVRFKLNEH